MPKAQQDIRLLIKVLRDLEEFLPYLVLVGGWAPLIYMRYLWKAIKQEPLTTVDIDFGFKSVSYKGKDTIADRVTQRRYGEHHVRLGHDTPFVPIAKLEKEGLKADIDFITAPATPDIVRDRLVGREILIHEIKDFDLLLENTLKVSVEGFGVTLPDPGRFIFHKLLTFSQRVKPDKLRKDLYYAYYVLFISPEREKLLGTVKSLVRDHEGGPTVRRNIEAYFGDTRGKGPAFIAEGARVTGIAAFVENIEEDAYERIRGLLTV
ncbi:MAG: hypothetical protein KCHDKBKB_02827 [Elusimicrobia bacterium]|nr:hypothetical protein [Elusimicrobiota bacterium]